MAVIKEQLANNTLEVPVFHPVAIKLQQVLHRSNFSIEEITALIMEDQSLASQVLRMANSPFFAGLNKVTTIRNAIVRLGSQEIANIAMMVSQMNLYSSTNKLFDRQMHALWRHSLGCAIGSRWLAAKAGYKSHQQEAFLGGLLHDIGKLFLLKVMEDVKKSSDHGLNISEPLIEEVVDVMHVEQGYQLMQHWGVPECYCNIAHEHHLQEFDRNDPLLILVRLANLACKKVYGGVPGDRDMILLTVPEAQSLGVKEIVLAELEIVIEDTIQTCDSLQQA